MSNCTVCGVEVSKRQSLAFKGGRACRSHEEVRKDQEAKAVDGKFKAGEDLLRVLSLSAGIRALVYQGHNKDFLMAQVMKLYGSAVHKEVAEELSKMGQMTDEEALANLLLYNEFMTRTEATKLVPGTVNV